MEIIIRNYYKFILIIYALKSASFELICIVLLFIYLDWVLFLFCSKMCKTFEKHWHIQKYKVYLNYQKGFN